MESWVERFMTVIGRSAALFRRFRDGIARRLHPLYDHAGVRCAPSVAPQVHAAKRRANRHVDVAVVHAARAHMPGLRHHAVGVVARTIALTENATVGSAADESQFSPHRTGALPRPVESAIVGKVCW